MKTFDDFRVTDPTKTVKILLDPSDRSEVPLITVPAVMKRTVENYPDHPALMYKDAFTKEWVAVTFKDYRNRVEKMAKVFIKLGLECHGIVAVLAFNSVEWFIAALAAIHAG